MALGRVSTSIGRASRSTSISHYRNAASPRSFGHSGSSKTTLLRCIAGLERAPQGRLAVDGEIWQDDAHWLPTHRRPIGYVFQEASLFPHLHRTRQPALRDEAQRSATRQPRTGDRTARYRRPARAQTRSALGRRASRVGIARALAVSPRLLAHGRAARRARSQAQAGNPATSKSCTTNSIFRCSMAIRPTKSHVWLTIWSPSIPVVASPTAARQTLAHRPADPARRRRRRCHRRGGQRARFTVASGLREFSRRPALVPRWRPSDRSSGASYTHPRTRRGIAREPSGQPASRTRCWQRSSPSPTTRTRRLRWCTSTSAERP